ncbi:UDP-N-acetylmuramate dehydrogenase [Alteromonas sp. 1_MG-2023]|uniref:UDP-N-acetylmuramate dehydrogenase n=1 Tax=Alteromonas sp. 1_MG-2023 TaxID=3062669 RepID=UPI0026E3CCC4|nr:UDP-N-acetylmuramate dehydrogenase [Alteromonas sp. 1_MG-2023]MDO6567498.1 UDP-N-acetylmuramate dehydrogenase [Alteromonas sp. 1_MG-2023]
MELHLPLDLQQQLNAKFKGEVEYLVPLNELSYWKIGGLAQCVITPLSLDSLQEALAITSEFNEIPRIVIGDCSNLLFDDEGFNGVLIKIGDGLSKISVSENSIYCEAGAWVPEVAYRSYRNSLSGIEHICGIPGRIGGLVYMNGGSQRRGILENVDNVVVMSLKGEIRTIFSNEIIHSYRESPFQGEPVIIAAVTLKLETKSRAIVRNDMRKILSSRRKKFPRKLPNCGSVFLSNPAMYDVIGPPGFAIEKAGLKGVRKGNAQLSPLHANFIVNLGGASSSDVLYLIALARNTVKELTGFSMDCEVRYIRPDGEMMQAHTYTDSLDV